MGNITAQPGPNYGEISGGNALPDYTYTNPADSYESPIPDIPYDGDGSSDGYGGDNYDFGDTTTDSGDWGSDWDWSNNDYAENPFFDWSV